MMTPDDFVRYYASTVNRVAASIAKSNPGIEASDIEQEIYLKVLQPGFLARITENDGGLVYTAATQAGVKYAENERMVYTYFSAEYIYTPAEIRTLLEDEFFNPLSWEEAPTKELDISIKSGGVVIALFDIREAFESLSEAEQTAIRSYYEFGVTPETPGEKSRVYRAIDKMTRFINGNIYDRGAAAHDGPGSRKATSNAAAVAATSNTY